MIQREPGLPSLDAITHTADETSVQSHKDDKAEDKNSRAFMKKYTAK